MTTLYTVTTFSKFLGAESSEYGTLSLQASTEQLRERIACSVRMPTDWPARSCARELGRMLQDSHRARWGHD